MGVLHTHLYTFMTLQEASDTVKQNADLKFLEQTFREINTKLSYI